MKAELRLINAFRAVVCFLFCTFATGLYAAQDIKLGFAGLSVSAMPITAADEMGAFSRAGLTVEQLQFKGGAPAIQALVGGGIDFMVGGAEHVLRLKMRGIDVAVFMALTNTHSYVLIGRADNPAKTIADLKGKNIGMTAPASTTDSTLRWELTKLGMNPDRDVTLLGVGQGAAMRSAIDAGRVEAGMVIFAEAIEMLQTPNKYKIIRDYRDMPFPGAVMIARTAWLKDHADAAKALATAILQGTKAVKDDKALAAKTVQTMFPTFDAAFAEKMGVEGAAHLSNDGRLSREGVDNMIAIMQTTEPETKPLPFEQIGTDAYLPK